MVLETCYAELLRGGTDKSPLATDGYKFPMAQAGFPLRHEMFYLSYRKGGPLYIPLDFAKVVQDLIPFVHVLMHADDQQCNRYEGPHARRHAGQKPGY